MEIHDSLVRASIEAGGGYVFTTAGDAFAAAFVSADMAVGCAVGIQADLAEVVRRHSSRANLQEKLLTLGEQMRVYRTRVDEINVQLVTLRKLPQGAKLRSHLASKMQEISEKLQAATMSLADMKAELMTQRIELQDKLAEIALQSKGDKLASKER